MRAQDAFDELVDGSVWPLLRAHDYMRAKYTFHRRVGRNWQVVNLQKSTRSHSETVRFTANLGVALEQLRTGAYDWAPGRRPAEYRCHLRARVGQLLSGRDTWWEVSADSELESLAETVRLVLELYAFPWLDAHSSEDGLVAIARDPEALREEQGQDPLRWLSKLMGQLGELDASRLVDAESARRHAERLR